MIAYTVLETLHCDAGSSRPYLWTELLVIDDDTIGSIGAGLRNHGNRDVRTVLTDHLGAGASVAVPESVARLGTRFRTGLQQRVLILVVLLLDQRDTPGFAMATGHSLFLSAVRDEVSANLLALNGPDGPDRDALIATITKRVSDRVTNAISDELSALDKASIFVGIDDPDRLIASAFRAFNDVHESAPFTLSLTRNDGERYRLDGRLVVTNDPCEQQLIDVEAIQANIGNIKGALKQLANAHGGEPTQKDEEKMDQLRAELQRRQTQLSAALGKLSICRTRHAAISGGDLSIGPTDVGTTQQPAPVGAATTTRPGATATPKGKHPQP